MPKQTRTPHIIRMGIGIIDIGLRTLKAEELGIFGMGDVKSVFQSAGQLLYLRNTDNGTECHRNIHLKILGRLVQLIFWI